MRSIVTIAVVTICLMLAFTPGANAQCVESQLSLGNIGISVMNNYAGQTFVACQSGVITSVTFRPGFTSSNTTFALQAGSGLTAPTHTQAITAAGFVVQVVNVAPGFPVVAGNSYSFGVRGNDVTFTNLTMVPGDTYVLGTAFTQNPGYSIIGGEDVYFSVSFDATVPAEASTWGAIKALYQR